MNPIRGKIINSRKGYVYRWPTKRPRAGGTIAELRQFQGPCAPHCIVAQKAPLSVPGTDSASSARWDVDSTLPPGKQGFVRLFEFADFTRFADGAFVLASAVAVSQRQCVPESGFHIAPRRGEVWVWGLTNAYPGGSAVFDALGAVVVAAPAGNGAMGRPAGPGRPGVYFFALTNRDGGERR